MRRFVGPRDNFWIGLLAVLLVITYSSFQKDEWSDPRWTGSHTNAGQSGTRVTSEAYSSNGTTQAGNVTDDGGLRPTIPLDYYTPLLPNPAPITDITVELCFPLSTCSPKSTPEQDVLLGKWVRVERSLSPSGQKGASAGGMISSLFGSIEQRYLFYRRSLRDDVQRVVDIQLVEEGEQHPQGDGWHRVEKDIRSKVMRMMSGQKSLRVYFRTVGGSSSGPEQDPFSERAIADSDLDAITELDLVYGDNPPWPGFEIAGVISTARPALGASRVSLAIRRKPQRRDPLEPLRFSADGSFKILQLADLHFSVNPEPCRGIDPSNPRWSGRDCLAKNDTLALIGEWLDTEKPDMVVLTGDQINGQGTSWDPRSVLPLYVTPLIHRKIPYAVILGNHDSESGPWSREEQMHVIQNLPYSYSMVGPAIITGDGNYYLKLQSPGTDRTHLATLWFMDTGARAEKQSWKPWLKPGYGYIHKDQIEWFERKYTAIPETLLPYHPDGTQDLGPQWRRHETWSANADQGQTMGRPPSIVFMHIPVPEAFNPLDKGSAISVSNPSASTPMSGAEAEMFVGSRAETATFEGGQSQPGIFDLFLSLNRPAGFPPSNLSGVKLLVHGHMHLNADCRRVNNMWICFGGGSSFAGYGDKAVRRQARVIVLRNWAQSIETYHRVDGVNEPVDKFTLPYA
ncbi:Metallo-dependent phosphatase [Testicularia cyperi]|uniref:Metallo-dependent phosphatase n=1 Tax=Testicularia cyperi TaxID=1882483 RepID=A0A317XJR7_9BASI|nr:Metallo-dependent phosphatase [Testicularia cyperi]